MKRLISLVLCAVLVLLCSLAGCGTTVTSSQVQSQTSSAGGLGTQFSLTNPVTDVVNTNHLKIKWNGVKKFETVTVKLEKQVGDKFVTVFEKSGINDSEYYYGEKLENATYKITLTAVAENGDKRVAANTKNGFVFKREDAKINKTVNAGKDFSFDGSISFEVLNNYLSRAMTYCLFETDTATMDEGLRAMLNTGAKYIMRSVVEWSPDLSGEGRYEHFKEWLSKAHDIDPEIIFEAGIFETTGPNIDGITIPKYVCDAFGVKYTGRCFNYENTLHSDNYGRKRWSEKLHVPDITKLETQMFIYYKATRYIDMGIESLHLGQANLIGQKDIDNACWTKVIHMIRDYAKKNARRHYVLINCHFPTQNFVGSDGVMLADFNAFPLRIDVKAGSVDHAVSETNPQECDIRTPPFGDAPYLKHIKGTSPSGWTTDNYPYLVEFDNWGGKCTELNVAAYRWGYDEISWFANQPRSYRHKFLMYINKKIVDFNDNGHVAMPGRRTAFILSKNAQLNYVMNDPAFCPGGFGDEAAIAKVWEEIK